ncbi:MAG: 2-oxoacid:acceptor oxidoreductase subunit alpha [candidate division WOR-3 bacterium]
MRKNDVAIKIAGLAGDGSLTTGELLSKVLKKMGFYVSLIKDFPSNIRGLPTNLTVRAKDRPIYGPKDYVDYLLALDFQNLPLHTDEVAPGGVIIYDNSTHPEIPEHLKRDDVHYYILPLANLSRENLGLEVIKNVVALGIIAELLNLDHDIAHKAIKEWFREKGEKIIESNIKAYEFGREKAKELGKKDEYIMEKLKDPGRIMMTGNDAIALGALTAGCRFEVAYPITPATEILEFFAKYGREFGAVTIQAEDEIASINFALGAAFAGARAMTTSSGPGLSLKTESLGLAYINETPLVIVDAQRAGPSTGLPTKTEQSDINHILFGGHGDQMRIVIVPATLEEGFYFTALAFNLAEKYQTPVVILTEQAFSQNKYTAEPGSIDPFKVEIDRGKLLSKEDIERIKKEGRLYLRYEITEDGISPRALPGMEGTIFTANSNEHDESGYTTEDPDVRKAMVDKRLRKYEVAKNSGELPRAVYYGDDDAEIGIIGMGATMGPILEAMEQLKEEGVKVRYMRIRTLWPFYDDEVNEFIEKYDKVFVVEMNARAQLLHLIRQFTVKHDKLHSITKYTGRMFRPAEIKEAILKVLQKV